MAWDSSILEWVKEIGERAVLSPSVKLGSSVDIAGNPVKKGHQANTPCQEFKGIASRLCRRPQKTCEFLFLSFERSDPYVTTSALFWTFESFKACILFVELNFETIETSQIGLPFGRTLFSHDVVVTK